ncbi:C40 family peptidase [Methylomicrobium sp. RS1]|uniref:C40 family peptidase n=1 Tax=Candidatus Methylomicrobium oryzae TaxID=2802053 RepID=UPI0030184A83
MKHQIEPFQTVFSPKPALAAVFALLVACSSAPKIAPVPVPTAQMPLPPVTRYALSLVGSPYRYGSASRDAGFDCSGFVRHVYQRHGILLPRTAGEMADVLPRAEDLRSGDLVFFNTDGGAFSHVGLFVSGDRFVHAASRRTGKVLVSSLNNPYWRKHFTGIRRPARRYALTLP